jgi:hypothetical protein
MNENEIKSFVAKEAEKLGQIYDPIELYITDDERRLLIKAVDLLIASEEAKPTDPEQQQRLEQLRQLYSYIWKSWRFKESIQTDIRRRLGRVKRRLAQGMTE